MKMHDQFAFVQEKEILCGQSLSAGICQILCSPPTSNKQHCRCIGSTKIPKTEKISYHAKLRYRSFDSRQSEDSLRRATRIRVFPQIAVIDRNIHLPLQERSTRYVHYRGFRQAELFQTCFLAFISCNICCSHICAMQNKDKGPSVIAKIY